MRRPGPAASAVLALALLVVAAAPARAQGVSIADAWVRFLGAGVPAAGYFTLRNDRAQPVELTGAASPDCGALMLHQSVVANGAAQMKMVKSVVVPPHGSVQFQPGGYHLMCTEPTAGMKPGRQVPVSLRLGDGSTIEAQFRVYGAKGR